MNHCKPEIKIFWRLSKCPKLHYFTRVMDKTKRRTFSTCFCLISPTVSSARPVPKPGFQHGWQCCSTTGCVLNVGRYWCDPFARPAGIAQKVVLSSLVFQIRWWERPCSDFSAESERIATERWIMTMHKARRDTRNVPNHMRLPCVRHALREYVVRSMKMIRRGLHVFTKERGPKMSLSPLSLCFSKCVAVMVEVKSSSPALRFRLRRCFHQAFCHLWFPRFSFSYICSGAVLKSNHTQDVG